MYYLLILDEATRHVWIVLLKRKSDAHEAFVTWLKRAERATGERMVTLAGDHGGEFIGARWEAWLAANGYARFFSNPRDPKENPYIEREMRVTKECGRAAHRESGLPREYWGRMAEYSVWCRGRLSRAGVETTTYEAFYQRRPSVKYAMAPGTRGWVYISPEDRRKGDWLTDKGVEGRMIGVAPNSFGWLMLLADGREVTSSHVDFWEDDDDDDAPTDVAIELHGPSGPSEPDVASISRELAPLPPPSPSVPTTPVLGPVDPPQPPPAPRRPRTARPLPPPREPSTRIRQQPRRLGQATEEQIEAYVAPLTAADEEAPDDDTPAPPAPAILSARMMRSRAWRDALVLKAKVRGDLVPAHRGEAMASNVAAKWSEAEQKELATLREKGVYEIAELPPGTDALPGVFVYALKRDEQGELQYDADGTVGGQKARFVARGDLQAPGSWANSFAATASQESLRLVCSIACRPGFQLYTADVKGAYLNAPLDHPIYMRIPRTDDRELEAARMGGRVWRLRKCLYGLVQSGYEWSKLLRSLLQALGYRCLDTDHGLYILERDGGQCYLPTHVDDLFGATNESALWRWTIDGLTRDITFSKEGPASLHLGTVITQAPDGSIYLGQGPFIDDLARENGLHEATPADTPMPPGTYLEAEGEPLTSGTPEEYRTLVGKLGWLPLTSRPDLAVAVRSLGRFLQNPREPHMKVARYCVRYLVGTRKYGICFREDGAGLLVYSDSDWAGQPDTRRSRSGWLVWRNGPVAWGSLLQLPHALSSAEAEFYAAATAMKRALPISFTAVELGVLDPDAPIPILIDNTAAIAILGSENISRNVRHISLRWSFVRHLVAQGIFEPIFVPSEHQAADLFTKALARARLAECRDLAGVVDIDASLLAAGGRMGGHSLV